RLRTWLHFRTFDGGEQLNALLRWVAEGVGLGAIELPTVRWPEPIEFFPDLANRTKREWPAVVDLLAGRSRQRIVLYEGESRLGKSVLIDKIMIYEKKLNIPSPGIHCQGLDIAGVLGQFDLDLGRFFPTFPRDGAEKPHLLQKALRTLRQP